VLSRGLHFPFLITDLAGIKGETLSKQMKTTPKKGVGREKGSKTKKKASLQM